MFPISALHLGLIVAIAIGCVALWNQIFALWSAGYDIVGYESRRSVPWGPRDVVVILIGVIVIVNLCTLSVTWLTKHQNESPDAAAATNEPEHDASQPVPDGTSPEGNDTETEVATAEVESAPEKPANKSRTIFSGACGTVLSLLAAILWLRLRGADREDLGCGGGALRARFPAGLGRLRGREHSGLPHSNRGRAVYPGRTSR